MATTVHRRRRGRVPSGRSPRRPTARRGKRIAGAMAVDKIGAVYVWIVIIVVFSIWVPETFPTPTPRSRS